MIDLSIVIITWKMRDKIEAMLASIEEHTQMLKYELIVVDNYSSDGTVEMIKSKFPGVIMVENMTNRGVAAARNQGMKRAGGKYVALLDADMLLRENSLKMMTEFMNANLDAGICGCRLVFPDNTLQRSARRYPTPLTFLLRRLSFIPAVRNSNQLRHHEIADWNREDLRSVDYLIGACQCIRKDAMEQVGLLDENIFYGPEDIDYCLRMYRAGWKVYFLPGTEIVHYEQRITKKKFFSRLTWFHIKGIFYLFTKYNWRLSRS